MALCFAKHRGSAVPPSSLTCVPASLCSALGGNSNRKEETPSLKDGFVRKNVNLSMGWFWGRLLGGGELLLCPLLETLGQLTFSKP